MLEAVAVAGGVLQQVGADRDAQGFGGFGRFRSGFALQDAGDVFFAVQAGDEFVLEQEQLAIAMDIELIAVGELDAIVALQGPGANTRSPDSTRFSG